jgi:hypothetical protein
MGWTIDEEGLDTADADSLASPPRSPDPQQILLFGAAPVE